MYPNAWTRARRVLAAAVTATIVVGGLAGFPGVAQAAPSNDNFANAQALTPYPGSLTMDTAGATAQAGEPDHAGQPATASVWFRYNAATGGIVTIDTCSSNFDTVLEVYTGTTLSNLDSVASSDDDCGIRSTVSFLATAGTSYPVAVDGVDGATDTLVLHWTAPTRPANDDFANARALTSYPGSLTMVTDGATAQNGEPAHDGNPATASVWFQYQASTTGLVTIDTCNSDYDTILAVYTGTKLSGLTPIASSDDDCGAQSSVSFLGTAGKSYAVAVDGTDGDTGNLALHWTAPVKPANDNFSHATSLTGTSGTVSGSTLAATNETGEPQPEDEVSGHSLWYSYTPAAAGTFTVDTCGSDFDTVLSVYTGSSLTALTQKASNDDALSSGCYAQSEITLAANAGTTYRIRVAGFGSEAGDLTLHYIRTAVGTPGPVAVTSLWPGDGWVSVAWNPPAFAGTSAIQSYRVTASPGGATTTVTAPGTRAMLSGLTNNQAYTFTVTPVDASGAGSPSTSQAGAPHAGSLGLITVFNDGDFARLQQMAAYMQLPLSQVPTTSVGVIAFILGLIPPAQTPIPPPVLSGTHPVILTLTTAQQSALIPVCRRYALAPDEAAVFSAELVGYLLSLSGH